MVKWLPIFLLLTLLVPNGEADTVLQSGDTSPRLIELFSTQSCSSCPPAQNWVSALKDHPGLWKDFVPVVFHVDYWDYLGWKDPYSSSRHTQRQRQYAATWNSRSVYTPMFVLDGDEWRARSRKAPSKKTSTLQGLKVKIDNDLNVEIKLGSKPKSPYVLHVVLLGNGIHTNVRAGENSGKRLSHEFLVLDHKKLSSKSASQFKTRLEPLKKHTANSFSIAIWIQDSKTRKIIEVLGGKIQRES